MAELTVGSLCTGYGGLDLAIHDVFGGELAWLAEYDEAPARVCEVRFPGVLNLGDITAVDWKQVPPVDVLTAGYPCQPFSHAGKRKGTKDVRHLWPYIADAVRVLRPQLVVLENVAGHVDLGLDVVLGDLASLLFDAEGCVVRASDVGACHQRARLFVVATDASGVGRRQGTGLRAGEPGGERWRRSGHDRGTDAPDADGRRLEVSGERNGGSLEPGLAASRRDDVDGLVSDAADAYVARLEGREPASGHVLPAWGGSWGSYGPAIDRHAQVLGRPAPSPVDEQGRLSPRFVEWMMMLPEGWVTDVLTTRTKALKALGNGVVPPQAAYAIRLLLDREAVAA